jgi:hypothetical protein
MLNEPLEWLPSDQANVSLADEDRKRELHQQIESNGPLFSENYHFVSRAGIVNLGIVAKTLAAYAKAWGGETYDVVFPVNMAALLGNYAYVTLRMMENAALQDKATIDGVSEANWIALSRLYVYFFQTLELGASYSRSLYLADVKGVTSSVLVYEAYRASVPWVGLGHAVWDFHCWLTQAMSLPTPQTQAEWDAYTKAWEAVTIYGVKLLATSMPFVFTSEHLKGHASHLTFLAALGFLWADLSNP